MCITKVIPHHINKNQIIHSLKHDSDIKTSNL